MLKIIKGIWNKKTQKIYKPSQDNSISSQSHSTNKEIKKKDLIVERHSKNKNERDKH